MYPVLLLWLKLMLCFCLYVTKIFICFIGNLSVDMASLDILWKKLNGFPQKIEVETGCVTFAFKGSEEWCYVFIGHP